MLQFCQYNTILPQFCQYNTICFSFVNIIQFCPSFVNIIQFGPGFVNIIQFCLRFVNIIQFCLSFVNIIQFCLIFVNKIQFCSKGQCHEIFDIFFYKKNSAWAKQAKSVSRNFFSPYFNIILLKFCQYKQYSFALGLYSGIKRSWMVIMKKNLVIFFKQSWF